MRQAAGRAGAGCGRRPGARSSGPRPGECGLSGWPTSVSGGGSLSAEVLAERLLLVIYAYGTNTGIKAVASGGHGHTEDELRYVRRRYLSAEAARAIAVNIANATFAARSTEPWGQGLTAVASDSTHVRAYDQNLFTEWYSRYGGRGVLIYWHVEKKSLAIHSQLINCTASEVAAVPFAVTRALPPANTDACCSARRQRVRVQPSPTSTSPLPVGSVPPSAGAPPAS
ncbi:Tn3 family transposase [Streptomyces vinaceus]|uniref:Tn3 family transposase n=1 Tax=Streptomyces vinaceus TaxID=1960 RepID=UPI0036AF08A2